MKLKLSLYILLCLSILCHGHSKAPEVMRVSDTDIRVASYQISGRKECSIKGNFVRSISVVTYNRSDSHNEDFYPIDAFFVFDSSGFPRKYQIARDLKLVESGVSGETSTLIVYYFWGRLKDLPRNLTVNLYMKACIEKNNAGKQTVVLYMTSYSPRNNNYYHKLSFLKDDTKDYCEYRPVEWKPNIFLGL